MYCCQDANMYEKVTSVISWNCPHANSESTESRITEGNDLILDTFSKYFASIFTKDDNNHLPTIDILPCKSEINEFLVTERMVSKQIRKLDITKSARPVSLLPKYLAQFICLANGAVTEI